MRSAPAVLRHRPFLLWDDEGIVGMVPASVGWSVQFFGDDGDYVAEEPIIAFCATKREKGNLSVVSIHVVTAGGMVDILVGEMAALEALRPNHVS
jgi:hypothetical protein